MKPLQQIENIYNSELKDSILKYSHIRIKMNRWKNYGILIILLTILSLFFGNTLTRIISSLAGFSGAIYTFSIAQLEYKKLIPHYKNEIVSRVINIINPDFKYSINGHIENHYFNESKIFEIESFACEGDDMVTGKIDKTNFKFSEFHARQYHYVKDDVYKGTKGPTIFHGIFFYAEFNKHIKGKTVILPNNYKGITNKLGQEKRDVRFYGKLVKLENPEFEKIFSVYADSQQEARYIITPAMMEAMMNTYQVCNRQLFFSFIGDNVYCAVNFYNNNGVIKGLFEPSGKKTDTDFSAVKEIYFLISLIETIIKEMNLNTRIWTKE